MALRTVLTPSETAVGDPVGIAPVAITIGSLMVMAVRCTLAGGSLWILDRHTWIPISQRL